MSIISQGFGGGAPDKLMPSAVGAVASKASNCAKGTGISLSLVRMLLLAKEISIYLQDLQNTLTQFEFNTRL